MIGIIVEIAVGSCQAVPGRSGIPPLMVVANNPLSLAGELTKLAHRGRMDSPTSTLVQAGLRRSPAAAGKEAFVTAAATAHRAIELELTIQAPPERVIAAFADQVLLESWFVRHSEVDPRPGGAFGCFWSTAHVMRTYLEVDPPGRIVIEFDERPVADGKTVLNLMVSPEGTGTRLHFKHTGFPVGPGWDELYEGMGAGWPHALADLTVLLETGVPAENGFRHV